MSWRQRIAAARLVAALDLYVEGELDALAVADLTVELKRAIGAGIVAVGRRQVRLERTGESSPAQVEEGWAAEADRQRTTLAEALGVTITQQRLDRGWPRCRLAGMIGIDSNHLAAIEEGRAEPTLSIE